MKAASRPTSSSNVGRGAGSCVAASRCAVALPAQSRIVGARSRRRRRQPAPTDEDVNRRNADGSTPLQWAVYDGDVAEVKRLLRAGADVSLANNYGATPMSLAAEVGNTDMLKVLLEAGANADSPNRRRTDRAAGGGANRQRRRRAAVARATAPPSMRGRSGADRPR